MNINKFKFTLPILFCCVIFFGGLDSSYGKDKLDIVTTITPLKSIAEAVGGNFVLVTSIGRGDEDPHFIAAKPSFMMKARKADLFIRIGLELEIGYEGLILQGSRNPKIQLGMPGYLDASEGINHLEVPVRRVYRSMGDVHPLGNPHYWLDPYNGRIIAKAICNRLKRLDPAHSADYDHNLASFLLKLDSAMFGPELTKQIEGEKLWKLLLNRQLDGFIREKSLSLGGWLAKIKPFEGSAIVTYHRSWTYFANRFNLDIVAELEPKPGIPPTPGHTLQVIQIIEADKVKVILTEPFYEHQSARTVADKTGAKVLIVPNAPDEQVKDYIAMLDNIVTKLADALSQE
jgi:zinc/manganese transport system substrate-binding protein